MFNNHAERNPSQNRQQKWEPVSQSAQSQPWSKHTPVFTTYSVKEMYSCRRMATVESGSLSFQSRETPEGIWHTEKSLNEMELNKAEEAGPWSAN